MGKPIPYTKEEVLEAVKGCNTIISTVAKRLNCDWNTAKKYIFKWKETASAYENERQKTIDFAEGKLIKKIEKEDLGAIKYFLSSKAKERGYGEEITQNIASAEGGPIKIEIID